jgi:hypothetical protein
MNRLLQLGAATGKSITELMTTTNLDKRYQLSRRPFSPLTRTKMVGAAFLANLIYH